MNLAVSTLKPKKGTCQLLSLTKHRVKQWLQSFDKIIYSGNGTLWTHDSAIPGVPETFNALRALGKPSYICSNSSTLSSREIRVKASGMGIFVNPDEVLNSAQAVARYLKEKNFKKKVYIVGEQGIVEELNLVGITSLPIGKDRLGLRSMASYLQTLHLDPDVGAVVVGNDEEFSVPKIVKAASYLANPNIMFLATNPDLISALGNNDCFTTGAGSLVACIAEITKRNPITVGKPNPFICAQLLREKILIPERTLLVGDTTYTDIQFGYNCGFQTMMVGTGVSSLDDVAKAQKSKKPHMYQQVPDMYLPNLSDLLQYLPSRNYWTVLKT